MGGACGGNGQRLPTIGGIFASGKGKKEDRTSGGLFTGSREMPRKAGLEDED